MYLLYYDQGLRRKKALRGGRITRRVFVGCYFKNAVNAFCPKHRAAGKVALPAAHTSNGLGCFQQLVQAFAVGLCQHKSTHVGKGANLATVGQKLGTHFQRAPCARLAHIACRQCVCRTHCGNDPFGAHGRVHQAGVWAKISPLQLDLHQFLFGGQGCQKLHRQVQQLAYPGVELADPAIGVKQQNALADAGQRGLQELCIF